MSALEVVAKAALDTAVRQSLQVFMRRRANDALALVIEEIRTANVDPNDIEEREDVAAMLVAFFMAMAQGAAFKNLRIMAKVLARKTADPGARQDDFVMWSNAIGGLLHEETVLLATLHREFANAQREVEDKEEARKLALDRLTAELVGPGRLFAEETEFNAVCGALTRTGFIVLLNTWGGSVPIPAPRLMQLAKMANLQAWADDA
jgi:hypothetical protein